MVGGGTWPAVTIVGLGGLGSWTALALAKCGFPLSVYDHDEVEQKNVQNQLYSNVCVGFQKVYALRAIVREHTPGAPDLDANDKAIKGKEVLATPIVVAAVDSLESRRAILAACKASPQVDILLDLRAGGGTIKVLTCAPHNAESVKWYTSTLVAAPEAMAVCLEAFEAHVGMIAAGLAVRTLQELLTCDGVERLIALHVPNLHLVQDGPHPWNT